MLRRLEPAELPTLLMSRFHPASLEAARDRAPEIARGVLFRVVPKRWRSVAEALDCVTVNADHRLLTPAIVAEIRDSGYSVLAYTVNDPERALTLFAWGVTSVFSDVPHIILAAAARGGPHSMDSRPQARTPPPRQE